VSILAQVRYKGNDLAVRVTDIYSIGVTRYAAIETLDGRSPFLTVGSKVTRHTPWTNIRVSDLVKVRCNHEHTFIASSGGMHFSSDIGAWDDIEEREYCKDCGEEVIRKVQTYTPLDVTEDAIF
jgi:hypothetical protein